MSPRRWRLAVAGLAVGLTLPVGLVGNPAVAAPDPEAAATARAVAAKVDKRVTNRISATGKSAFWVFLDSQADLTATARLRAKADKAAAVLRAKTAHADRSQAGLRALLTARGADFTPFWLVNTIKVTGDAALLGEIATRGDVREVVADEPVALPEPIAADTVPTVDGVEWNIDRINAPQVWNGLGVRGEGIVVAGIDTGVNYLHPALNASYRGRQADGSYDHAYNWFDPTGSCAGDAPCDNNDHGSHTMGSMVGLDGENVVGVAPGATWIAAKGCASSSCARDTLLAAGQWMVAPTDSAGANPRPDLAPDVINNSWGNTTYDPWYAETVSAWVAAGIFPAFSNGNSGPNCNTSGSPGMYSISYSSGAFDVNNAIASFSSRGTGENGEIKPNIAAPGANVRSSVRTGYGSFSGTSMASPHTAATVALMWSASPAIHGDVAATRAILDDTAIDVNALTCGGTVEKNNVFGEGRLDAYAAVEATPRGALGAVAGAVTSAGQPLAGASVAVAGPTTRTTTTAADGSYGFERLMVGDYTVTVTKFGYLTATGQFTVTEDQTTTADVAVEQAASATLTGTVSTSAGPAAGATVTVLNTPVTATADAQGRYRVTVPQGKYDVRYEHAYRCADGVTRPTTVQTDEVQDVVLPDRVDAFGYACGAADGTFVPGVQQLDITGDDKTVPVTLPFRVPLYGKSYREAWVSSNGVLGFGVATTNRLNTTIPTTGTPNLALFPFWDDLYVETDSAVYTTAFGSAPRRTFLVEWRNVSLYADRTQRLTFSAAISEDGSVVFRYKDVDGGGPQTGTGATIGLENEAGTEGFLYSFNTAAVADGAAIAFRTTRTGVLSGVVTDANDGLPVAGATVTTRVGDTSVTDTSDASGRYLVQAPAGAAQVSLASANYETATATATLTAGASEVRSAALRTARITASAASLTVTAPAAQTRSRSITLSNTGTLDAEVVVTELDADGFPADIGWLELTGGSATVAPGARHTVGLGIRTAGLAPGSYHQAKVQITSPSGRKPVLVVPVTLVVPSWTLAVDAGANAGRTDVEGQTWSPDRAYSAGGAGYLGASTRQSTARAITGTNDPARFADLREGMYEYRVDGLADGHYTVELDFAEVRIQRPDTRVFDVLLEGQEVLPSLDVAGEVGNFAALNRTYTVQVTDGSLNIRFVTHKGFGVPIVNALRVTNRPDLG
ncbi:S8 family serine peptidase [Micromonospora sp. WMMD882]|uniref:S8 family serine peptidase n=1 Tax=Micromonospora sp. WMMD882 TaxID=3015151 RepID=UPI00248B3EF4|nr:S8 family serine peptidase [Micromonospora sp. WMMD882]WBB81951.1 S8 family serine peptidase [Micromonospora sp. WMMD882]